MLDYVYDYYITKIENHFYYMLHTFQYIRTLWAVAGSDGIVLALASSMIGLLNQWMIDYNRL